MPTLEESFCNAEERALRFLQDSYGFRAVERHTTPETSSWMGGVASYRSQASRSGGPPEGWTVTLAYAPARLELSLDIADETGNSFSVEELYALSGRAPFPRGEHSLYDSRQDEEALFCEFTRLAEALKLCGSRFFAGDRSLWLDLRSQRERATQAEEDRRAFTRSETAFQAKDWIEVVSALGPREARLSKAGIARLNIARKRLQGAA